MLTTLNLKVGSILHDMEQNIDHRVIYMNKDYLVTILINGIKEKTEINEWHIQTLQHFVNKKQIAVREPKFDKVFDFDSLPEKTKEIYLRNKDIVETVGDIYGPCYFCLGTRKPKPCFQELADKYNISKKTVFYVIKQYLTNGLDPFALLPQIGKKSKANMHYSTKTGRPPMFEQGIPLTDELREIFDDCCKHYLSGREKSYATTYDWMLTKYFTARVETQTSKGVVVQNKLLPIDQRPTKSQMENYIVTHTSAKARRVCKTSKREYRNNERMLVSDNLLNVNQARTEELEDERILTIAEEEKNKYQMPESNISNMVYESKMMTKVIDLVREIYVEFDFDSIGKATRDVNHRLKPHEVAKQVLAILNEEPVKPKRKATRRTPASKNICDYITDDN